MRQGGTSAASKVNTDNALVTWATRLCATAFVECERRSEGCRAGQADSSKRKKLECDWKTGTIK